MTKKLLLVKSSKKISIKALHHKYIIRALVGGASVRDDIVIATKSSTPDKIKLSGNKADQLPRMLKFSVLRGIGIAYEPMLDENGKEIKLDGKYVYKEIPTSERKYETIISEIYKLSFRQLDGHEEDVKLFYSYVGILQLMKKFLTEVEIKRTHNRFLDMLWGVGTEKGQVLETSSRELDFEVKNAGYQKFIKTLGLKDESTKLIQKYYKEVFKDKQVNESKTFRSLLKSLINENKKQIKYFTLNGFEVRMTHKGYAEFYGDNAETIRHWEGLKSEDGKSYFRTKEFKDFVVVYVGKDFSDASLRKYVEKHYDNIVKEI